MTNEQTVEDVVSLSDKVVSWMGKIEELAQDHTADAIELSMNTVRLDAASTIIESLVWIIVSFVVIRYYTIGRIKYHMKAIERHDYNDEFFPIISTVVLFGISFILILHSLKAVLSIFNVFLWAGIFYPEIYLGHLVFDRTFK